MPGRRAPDAFGPAAPPRMNAPGSLIATAAQDAGHALGRTARFFD
jgi:hypothetical protein